MEKSKEIPALFCEPVSLESSSEEWDRVFQWVEYATSYYIRINGTNPWFSEVRSEKMYLQVANLFESMI